MLNENKKIKKFKFKSSFIRLGLLLVTGFLFIFSSLSILYYDSKDISWIHYDTADKAISNILGSWGANIAATYFYYLGFGAYLVLIFLAYLIYFLVLKLDFKQEWEKILGFLGLNLSLILLFKQGSWGYFLRDLLSKNFDNLAINIIGFGCLFASLILIIRFSFIEIIQKTVFYLKNIIYIYNFFNFIYVNI